MFFLNLTLFVYCCFYVLCVFFWKYIFQKETVYLEKKQGEFDVTEKVKRKKR